MEYTPTYKLPKKVRPCLMEPPPYCRSTSRAQALDLSASPVTLEVSDPSKLLSFVESLKDNNSKGLEKRINKYLKRETESQQAFLISITNEEAYVQVVGTKKLELIKRNKVPPGIINAMYEKYKDPQCASLGELHPAFTELMSAALDNKSCNIVTIPILTPNNSYISLLLVCLVNPGKNNSFIARMVNEAFRFSLTVLLNTTTSEEEAKTKKECQALLGVARKLFTHLGDLTDLLREIMAEARNLVDAERCSLFLLDEANENLVATVFDGSTSSDVKEVKFPKCAGIAGHVATSGEVVNIKNAYDHPFFYKGIDERTGFKTRNILCFPIRDERGIIGVAQLCNKKEGDFTVEDEETALAFSVYCGLSIMHSLVYKKTNEAQIRTQLSNELMMYHMKVDDESVKWMLHCTDPHNIPNFENLNFSPRNIPLSETPCYIMKMFERLKLVTKFDINKETLARFILYVQKGYRDTAYHNWMHAVCVTHFCYVTIRNFKMIDYGYLSQLEALALLTSCLGHDLDHRGTTNSFQVKVGTTLASLYSSDGSVMERHHLSQTLCILNMQKCNFLECLDNQSFRRVLDMLRDCILATDLATHFKLLPRMEEIVTRGYYKSNLEHRKTLLSLMMTCGDLSDQTKGFKIAQNVAEMVYEEFFTQGDIEKRMGNQPILMMDREKASIPDLQIEFLDTVCIPTYTILTRLFPAAQQFIDIMESTKQCWEASKAIFHRHYQAGRGSLEILKNTALEEEVMEEMGNDNVEVPNTNVL
ncbi:hypothetical protein Trydic_g22418 [Trypoxylus dichotomus]